MAEMWKALKDPCLWKEALPGLLLRLVSGTALALLWHFTLGSPGRGWDLIALFLAFFFLCLAWFRYLRYDGFLDHRLTSPRPEAMKKNILFRDMWEARPDTDEMPEEKEERLARRFLANLVAGIIFLLAGVVASLWG